MNVVPIDKLKNLPPQCKQRIHKYIPAYGRLLNFLGFPHDNLTLEQFVFAHVKQGNLEIIKWSQIDGYMVSWCEQEAADLGHLHILKWAREHTYPCDDVTSLLAAAGGHINVLEWLKKNTKFKMAAYLCDAAVEGNSLKGLKWLRAQDPPCRWSKSTSDTAKRLNHLHLLKWMREQNPPCPGSREPKN